MSLNNKVTLGRTDLNVGRLGISSSYGAKAEVFEEAFDRGYNYFTWGTFIKGDSRQMKIAIRNLISQGKRDEIVISVFTYAHEPFLTRYFLKRRLKSLGVDHIDVLLLGYYNSPPSGRILDGARQLKEDGMVRYLGLSSHNRKMFRELRNDSDIDVLHIRYNPAHRGAEEEIFPYFDFKKRPGIVSFTATRWGKLLNPKKMPSGEKPLSAAECYRNVLANPMVDVCMMGVKNIKELRENISLIEMGNLNDEEMERIRRIGTFVHQH
jgi:aryl-alcohol dehydrogenase-like predicted oxidoreductase